MPENRFFTEEEATEILKHAALLHESSSEASSQYKPGITSADLEAMAEDMGIDPTYLQMAMRERVAPHAKLASKSRSGISLNLERVIDGELSPDDMYVVLEAVGGGQTATSGLRQIGRSLQGMISAGPSTVNLSVSSKNGRTRVIANAKPVLGIVFGAQIALMSTIGGLIGTFAEGAPLAAIAIPVGIGAGYGLYKWLKGIGDRMSEKMFEKICSRIDEANRESQERESDPEPEIR